MQYDELSTPELQSRLRAIEWGHWADAELCADEIAKIREQIIRAIEVPSRPG